MHKIHLNEKKRVRYPRKYQNGDPAHMQQAENCVRVRSKYSAAAERLPRVGANREFTF